MQLLFQDFSTVTVSSSGEVADVGAVTNLVDYNPLTRWISSTTGSGVWCGWHQPAAPTIDCVGFANHNFDELTGCTITLEGASDWGFTSNVLSRSLITSSGNYIQAVAPLSRTYIRVLFSGTFNVEPRLGMVYAARCVEVPDNFTGDYIWDDFEHLTKDAQNLLGNMTPSTPYPGGRFTGEFSFRYNTAANRATWLAFLNSVQGPLLPFFFEGPDGLTHVVRFAQGYNPIKARTYNLFEWHKVRVQGMEYTGNTEDERTILGIPETWEDITTVT